MTHRRSISLVVSVLIAIAAGLSICTPVLHASNDATALRSEGSSIQAHVLASPLDMVVPRHATRTDWRLKPVVGLGPVTPIDLPSAPSVEVDADAARHLHVDPTGDTLRTRAPPA